MANPTSNTRVKKKSLVPALQELLSVAQNLQTATKEVESYSKEIQTNEKLQLEISSLKAQLETKEKCVIQSNIQKTELEQKLKDMSIHFEQRVVDLKIQAEQLESQVKSGQANYKKSLDKTNGELHKKIKTYQKTIENQQDEIDIQKTTISGLQTRLRSLSGDLQNFKDKIGWQKIESDFIVDLQSLERDLETLTKEFFCVECPLRVNHADILVELRRSLPQKRRAQPQLEEMFPFSNTASAMCLRAAVMESLIARHIATDIFRDSRIVATRRKWKMDDFLNDLVRVDGIQEAMFRSLLHVVFKDEEMELRESAISEAIRDISKVPQLILHDRFENFLGKLRGLLEKAADAWEKAQRSTRKVLCTVNSDEFDEWSKRTYDIPEEFIINNGKDIQSKQPEMVLFPRVWFYSESQALHRGTAIWSDQATLLARLSESEQRSSNGNHRRSPSQSQKHDRRGSITGPILVSRARTMEESPSGSLTSPNGSYSQRMKNSE